MHEHLRKDKLLVISDTAFYNEQGVTLAFEPVVRELEALQPYFNQIVWLGCRIEKKDKALKAPQGGRIKMITMPASINRYLNAVFIALHYPLYLYHVLRHLPGSTHVHTRAPSHPALIGILISFFDRNRIYWHKYAGDWSSANLPFTYHLQRRLLKAFHYKNIRVTVNGKWKDDPPQVHAFENPCVYESDLEAAAEAAKFKSFRGNLLLLFVGGLNKNKGIIELIDAIQHYDIPGVFTNMYIIGNGPLYETVKTKAAQVKKLQITVIGPINRSEIDEYYGKCHFLILPSKSEGFPKVIAEAAAYGCVPIVTDVSSVSQYIVENINGYLLKDNRPATIAHTLSGIAERNNLKDVSHNTTCLAKKFTFERFVHRINRQIFSR